MATPTLGIELNFTLGTTNTATLTDTSNYAAETYSDLYGNLRAIAPNGTQFYNNTSWVSPTIDYNSSPTSASFPLPLVNGVVQTGIYTWIYTVRLVDQLQSFLIVSNDSPAKTFTINGNYVSQINAGANFECVDSSTTSLTIVSATYSSTTGLTTVTIGETLGTLTALAQFQFTLTTDYSQTFTQNYTYVSPSVCISVNVDNCCSTLTLTDITAYLSGAIVTRLHTISYPQGMVTPIADIESPLQEVTVTPIWTGTWTDVFTATISGSQGIINISDSVRGVQSFAVTNDQYDCQISACLQAVVNRYSASILSAPSQTADIGKYLLQALGVVSAYQLAKKCGDANATDFLNDIKAIVKDCGCDCGCDNCADDTPTQVVGCCQTVGSSTNTILMTSSDGSITIDATTVGSTTTFDVIVDSTWFVTNFNNNFATKTIDDLSGVVLTSPTTGQSFVYNGTNWVNGTAQLSLLGLTDVATTPTNGQVVYWNSGTGKFQFKTIATPAISNLSDVSLTSIQNGQILKYVSGSSNWQNTYNDFSTLRDVNVSGIANNQSVKWDSGTSKYIPYTPTTALTGLTDVDITTASLQQSDLLMYDNASSKWINQAKATFVVESNASFNAGVFDNSVTGYYQVAIKYNVIDGSKVIRGVADNLAGAGVAQTTIFTIANSAYFPSAEVPFIVTGGLGVVPTIVGGSISTTGVVSVAWYIEPTTGVRTAGYPAGDIDLGQIPSWI